MPLKRVVEDIVHHKLADFKDCLAHVELLVASFNTSIILTLIPFHQNKSGLASHLETFLCPPGSFDAHWINAFVEYWILYELEELFVKSSSSTRFLIELEFGNVGFWGEGKTVVPGEKPLGAKERTNNKLNPHVASTPGFEPGSHWWEASALTTALSHFAIPCSPISVTVYSDFEKGRRIKCTRQSRKVSWVVLSSLFSKEIWKNGTRGHGRMFVSAKGK